MLQNIPIIDDDDETNIDDDEDFFPAYLNGKEANSLAESDRSSSDVNVQVFAVRLYRQCMILNLKFVFYEMLYWIIGWVFFCFFFHCLPVTSGTGKLYINMQLIFLALFCKYFVVVNLHTKNFVDSSATSPYLFVLVF